MSCCFGAGIDVDTPFHTILNVDTKIMLQRRHFQECFLVVGTVSAFSFRFARGFHYGTLLRMEAQGPPLLLNGKGVRSSCSSSALLYVRKDRQDQGRGAQDGHLHFHTVPEL